MDIRPEQVLHELMKKSPTARWAFVVHKNQVFFAGDTGFQDGGAGLDSGKNITADIEAGRRTCAMGSPKPTSPTVKLLQGLFEQYRDLSFFILRERIYLNYAPGPMDRGFIDLVAKRWSRIENLPPEETESQASDVSGFTFQEVTPLDEDYFRPRLLRRAAELSDYEIKDTDAARAALSRLEAQISRGEVLHDHARPIAAILCQGNGKVLAASLHNAVINKTLHAEIDLIQQLFRGGFKPDPQTCYDLYVSLKPCRMCAGTWREVFGDRLRVYYASEDLGPKARNTAFEQFQQQQCLN